MGLMAQRHRGFSMRAGSTERASSALRASAGHPFGSLAERGVGCHGANESHDVCGPAFGGGLRGCGIALVIGPDGENSMTITGGDVGSGHAGPALPPVAATGSMRARRDDELQMIPGRKSTSAIVGAFDGLRGMNAGLIESASG